MSYIRGRNAGMFSMARPSASAVAAFDKMVGDIYGQFLKVAKGRAWVPKVVEVAGGRVWSGTAHGVKLVDEIGGFCEALARARKAKIPSGRTRPIAFGQRLGAGSTGAHERQPVPAVAQHAALDLPNRDVAADQAMGDERVWAMMPYTVDVR